MKLAIGYSSKNQLELTKQTLPRLLTTTPVEHLLWADASTDSEAKEYPFSIKLDPDQNQPAHRRIETVFGGADAAIVWKLTYLLKTDADYFGIMENDVLLDEDWFEPTMELFERGRQDGLEVGTVSPRSYVDRVLIQRDKYAVMHNIGAGFIILTRQAAQILLQSFRTHWWQDNVRLFAQLSGIDLRTYAAFRTNEQFVTSDWGFEAMLATHGLAALALTPAKCEMIGQQPSLAKQGLELVSGEYVANERDDYAFENYSEKLEYIRNGSFTIERPQILHRAGAGMVFFPHQVGMINGIYSGNWKLRWTQGLGPFSYRAGLGGASLSVPVSGTCSFLLSGDIDAVHGSTITDTRSGFKSTPTLQPALNGLLTCPVPGRPATREIRLDLMEGGVFYGIETDQPQLLDARFKFDWTQLPEV